MLSSNTPPSPELLRHLTPNAAVLLGTLGLCLVFLEFNRPGRILPAALGLLLTLLAAAGLWRSGLQPWAATLLLISSLTLLANAWRALPIPLLVTATVGLIAGLRWLIRPGPAGAVHLAVALPAGVLLGSLSAVLTRIALRARRAKALD